MRERNNNEREKDETGDRMGASTAGERVRVARTAREKVEEYLT
jgi:hypothetical protein